MEERFLEILLVVSVVGLVFGAVIVRDHINASREEARHLEGRNRAEQAVRNAEAEGFRLERVEFASALSSDLSEWRLVLQVDDVSDIALHVMHAGDCVQAKIYGSDVCRVDAWNPAALREAVEESLSRRRGEVSACEDAH